MRTLYVDTENVMWLLPICMVIIPFVYFVRVKLYDKYVHGIDLEAMDAELKLYKEKEKKKYPNVQSSDELLTRGPNGSFRRSLQQNLV